MSVVSTACQKLASVWIFAISTFNCRSEIAPKKRVYQYTSKSFIFQIPLVVYFAIHTAHQKSINFAPPKPRAGGSVSRQNFVLRSFFPFTWSAVRGSFGIWEGRGVVGERGSNHHTATAAVIIHGGGRAFFTFRVIHPPSPRVLACDCINSWTAYAAATAAKWHSWSYPKLAKLFPSVRITTST